MGELPRKRSSGVLPSARVSQNAETETPKKRAPLKVLLHGCSDRFTKKVFVRKSGGSGTALFNEVGVNIGGDGRLRMAHLLRHVNNVLALRNLPRALERGTAKGPEPEGPIWPPDFRPFAFLLFFSCSAASKTPEQDRSSGR